MGVKRFLLRNARTIFNCGTVAVKVPASERFQGLGQVQAECGPAVAPPRSLEFCLRSGRVVHRLQRGWGLGGIFTVVCLIGNLDFVFISVG